ncbi:hypothetical protein SPBR_08657 [Sporothrix brasiliensis 5110]|uniref:Uncharacterized protein n=1 Tax=Sporothrix brasiliensis 5110 TaxID=1398154 RepID=A0A0C2IH61_9PEZI|nr:uncharacterized protein SPBR_08657 [Sporothrix brasiliensis 5110]KIH86370.1 hypothetical protein SPBR_08657 [Sporothrix brasiliensis 5110]
MEQLGRHHVPVPRRVLDQPVVKLGQRHNHPLNVLAVLETLLGRHAVVLGQVHVHHDQLHVGVAHARVGSLRRAHARHATLIARLLLELAHGGLLGRLIGVNQPCGPLDRVGVQGRAVLNHNERRRRAPGMAQNIAHGDGVDTRLAAGLARGDLPGAALAGLVDILDTLESEPASFGRLEVVNAGDDGFLGLGRHGEGAGETRVNSCVECKYRGRAGNSSSDAEASAGIHELGRERERREVQFSMWAFECEIQMSTAGTQ